MFNSLKVSALQFLNKPISPKHLTKLENGLPILVLPNLTNSNIDECKKRPNDFIPKRVNSTFRLREIVIPYDDESTYPGGLTLLQSLSKSNLHRPKMGLFQWNLISSSEAEDGICIRPLPIAKVDMTLPSPSFIFQCDSLDLVHSTFSKDATFHKVGYNSTANGQLMLNHRNLVGLDLRYCQSKELSTFFAEAQESLMAGSLDDLQNVNVMVEGGNIQNTRSANIVPLNQEGVGKAMDSSPAKLDSMNGLGDCWMEFRANMKRPFGYFEGKSRRKVVQRTVKAPDLPYE
jgi:hypothetical protein